MIFLRKDHEVKGTKGHEEINLISVGFVKNVVVLCEKKLHNDHEVKGTKGHEEINLISVVFVKNVVAPCETNCTK
ncbi:hypothetical protein D9M69_581310 [compost metagenome]